MEEDINRMKYILEFGKKTGIHYVLETDDEKSLNNILNELERLQKENEELNHENIELKLNKIIKRASVKQNDNFYDYYKENALKNEKTVHTCLHCGNDTPLYCEKCQQELITKNAELQIMLKNSIKYTNELEKDLFENCSNYVVPKQLIRDKIQELENEQKQLLKGMKGQDRYDAKQEYMYKINVLKELLK